MVRRHLQPSRAAVVVALLLACAQLAAASRCKRVRKDLPPEELSFNHQPAPQLSLEELPKSFDWNNVDGRSMLAPSWNQHIPQYCGSCWLHGSTSMIQDRLKIIKGGIGPDTMLARQVVLNCGAFHGFGEGCNGGDVIDVVRYMKHFGLPDESCMPYSATDHTKYGKHVRKCPASAYCTNCMPLKGEDTCWPVRSPIRYYLSSYGKVEAPGQEAMMSEILARGPVTCGMATAELFDYGYHNGVYVDSTNATDVDHDVEVVGWGEEEGGLKYWIIRNSWGTYWGDLGFFKLQRGVNAMQIEAGDCWYAVPTWQDEQDVRSGEKLGTMWGIFDKEEADRIIPEGHRRPHFKRDDDKPLSPAAQAALAEDEYEATPEDLPSGRVPVSKPAMQQARQAQQAQQGQHQPKGEAAPSLRLQPFGQAAAQA